MAAPPVAPLRHPDGGGGGAGGGAGGGVGLPLDGDKAVLDTPPGGKPELFPSIGRTSLVW